MSRIIAILGGGDWADASVSHLVLPEGMNLEELQAEYNRGYKDGKYSYPNFVTLEDFLRSRGATDPGTDQLLVIET